jgi:hypothetical protein
MTATALRPPLRMPWTMLACALVMAVVVAVEWLHFPSGLPAGEAAPLPPAAPAEAPLARFVPPPDVRFAEIARRPLFIPGRRPQENLEPVKPPPPVPPPVLQVQGVVLAPDRRYAIIKHGNPPKLASLAVGATVDGWRIESIESDYVALRSGTTRLEFPVGKPATPTQRARPAAAPSARGWGNTPRF